MSVQTLTPQQLGDYFIPVEQSRFNFVQKAEFMSSIVSQEHRLQNINYQDKAISDSDKYKGENVYYQSAYLSSPPHDSRVMDQNYAQKYLTENLAETFNPTLNSKPIQRKSKLTKRCKQGAKKILVTKQVETNENVGILSAEIEREQEYQNQMNMIYNNPAYLEQFSHQLQYQQEIHFKINQDHAPMYFIPLQQQQQSENMSNSSSPMPEESSSMSLESSASSSKSSKDAFLEVEISSDYYSDSANSSDTEDDNNNDEHDDDNESECGMSSFHEFEPHFTTFDKTSYDLHNTQEDDSMLELDEELNNLVLSIITE